MLLSPRQKDFIAVFDVDTVRVVNTCNKNTYYTVSSYNTACLGLSPSGTVVVIAERTESDCTITAYEPDKRIRTRIVVPWVPHGVAVNNSVSALAMAVRTPELPYDVVLIYDVLKDNMTSVVHGYGAAINQLRFITNASLMINKGVVMLDL
jgi:hypothetical protein